MRAYGRVQARREARSRIAPVTAASRREIMRIAFGPCACDNCRVLAVQLLLVAILLAGGLSLLYPSPAIAVLLAGLSAAWLPTNNGHLEGPILLTVSDGHGLTTADLLAYVGLALAVLAGWRWRRDRMRAHGSDGSGVRWPAMAAFVVVLALLFGCGLVASWLDHHRRNAGSLGIGACRHDGDRYRPRPQSDSEGEMVVTLAAMSERATKRGLAAGVPAVCRPASRPTSDHCIEEATQ